jgi:hypothetical protein
MNPTQSQGFCRSAVSLSSFGGEGQGEEALYASDIAVHARPLYSASQVAGGLSVQLLSQLLDWWRNEAIVFHLPHHLQAARAPLQHVLDLPQNTFPIAAPLMIPKAQLLNVLGGQELLSRRVMCLLPGKPVFKAVQFHGQPSCGAIEVKKVATERMLASEFEPRKAACSQRLPELGLFACLLAPQPPGIAGRIHGVERRHVLREDKPWPSARSIHRGKWVKGPPLPNPLLQRRRGRTIRPLTASAKMRGRCSEDGRTPAQSPSVVVPARCARLHTSLEMWLG